MFIAVEDGNGRHSERHVHFQDDAALGQAIRDALRGELWANATCGLALNAVEKSQGRFTGPLWAGFMRRLPVPPTRSAPRN